VRILFITSVFHTSSSRNLNSYQRVHFLSRKANLTILAAKKSDFSASAQAGTHIINSPLGGKAGLICFSFFWLLGAGRKKTYDLVITEPSLVGVCGFWGKLAGRMKWVVDVWDIPIRCHSSSILSRIRCRITQRVMMLLYRYADLFIVSILPDFELKSFQLPKERMLLLKNAIWPEKPGQSVPPPQPQTSFGILCMRSLYTADMGLDTLSHAFRILSSELEGISLVIVGVIPHELEYQVADLKSLQNVEFHEFVEHGRLLEMIRQASACVIPFKNVPDLAQTYPIKVLEYLSLGKAIVASNIDGIKGMIEHGVNGLLFEAGDHQDLAAKVRQLYQNRNLRDTVSANALKLSSEFDYVTKNTVIFKRLQDVLSQGSP